MMTQETPPENRGWPAEERKQVLDLLRFLVIILMGVLAASLVMAGVSSLLR
jgi:hypothetical protein